MQRVTIGGRITCSDRPAARVQVWVGAERVRANGAGRYRATIRARGEVPVFVHQFQTGRMSFCVAQRASVTVGGPRVGADFTLRPGRTRGLL